MLQEAPGIIASIAGNKAGADMVGPGFENHVRTTKIVDGKLTTTTEKIEVPMESPPLLNMYKETRSSSIFTNKV